MKETREETGTRFPRRKEVKEMEEQQGVVSRRNKGRKNSRERRGESAKGVMKLRFGLGKGITESQTTKCLTVSVFIIDELLLYQLLFREKSGFVSL